MPDINVLALLTATVVSFVIGAAYYALLANQLADAASDKQEMPPWKIAVEVLRCLLVATVVAGVASEAGIDDLAAGFLLGLALWFGFPFVLWIGAVVHEGVPVKMAAIHAGDWLVKLCAIGLIVGAWA